MARSTFPTQKGKSIARSDHFRKLRCRTSARRCGAKHISKSKVSKTHGLRQLLEVELSKKVHAVVARSTFPSQKGKSIARSDHFRKLSCRKSARRCGAKHISKSKVSKHFMFGPLSEVELSKKCTPLWREAHFQVKKVKTLYVRTTFGS